MHFFFFGTLKDKDLLEIVLDRQIDDSELLPAQLYGYKLVTTTHDKSPVLVEDEESSVNGAVFEAGNENEINRIDFFEDIEYKNTELETELKDGTNVSARVYISTHLDTDYKQQWDFQAWQIKHKPTLLLLAKQWMTHLGEIDLTEAEIEWDALKAELESA